MKAKSTVFSLVFAIVSVVFLVSLAEASKFNRWAKESDVTPKLDYEIVVRHITENDNHIQVGSPKPDFEGMLKAGLAMIPELKKKIKPEDKLKLRRVELEALKGGEFDERVFKILQELLKKYPVDNSIKAVSKGNRGTVLQAPNGKIVVHHHAPVFNGLPTGTTGVSYSERTCVSRPAAIGTAAVGERVLVQRPRRGR